MNEERIFKLLYGKSLRYLGLKLRSEKEMSSKLDEWYKQSGYGHSESEMQEITENNGVLERVIDQLKKEKFIDDERFAREWIVSRLKRGKRGPGIIKMELRQKGIDEDLVRTALQAVEDESEGVSADSGAMLAGEKYLRKLAGKDVREQKMKVQIYLRGKGFSASSVQMVLKELFK